MGHSLPLKPVARNEWVFSYPKEYDEAHDYFIDGLEELDSGNIKKANIKFKKALSIFPQHIDALHHLSIITKDADGARKLNETAVGIGLTAFPKSLIRVKTN